MTMSNNKPIHVCSRFQAINFQPEHFHCSLCISIGNGRQDDVRLVNGLTEKFSHVLRLRFDDIECEIETMQAFNRNLALKILNDVNFIKEDSDVLIHCEGGISRSVAIGFFLSKLLNRNLILHTASDHTRMNRLVLKCLKSAYLYHCLRRFKLPKYGVISLQPQF